MIAGALDFAIAMWVLLRSTGHQEQIPNDGKLLETKTGRRARPLVVANPGTTDLHSAEQESSRAFIFLLCRPSLQVRRVISALFVFLQNPLEEDGFAGAKCIVTYLGSAVPLKLALCWHGEVRWRSC
jgi:hypothetical protein